MVLGLIIGIIYLFCDIFYWVKLAASLLALRLWKKSHRRRFDLYDYEVENEPEKLGFIAPKEEKILESPLTEEQIQNSADEVFFYGTSSKSETLVVRILRSCNDESEAWIYLKLADGRCFELEQISGFQRNFGDKCTSFTSGGLQMHYMSAMRRWRIVFCGMLRERTSPNTNETKSVFVKFTFIWTASSDVYDGVSDFDIQAAAKGMAQSKWNSFLPPVNKLSESLNFYCQSGVLNGVVTIEDETEKEMYFFGEKIRFLGKISNLYGCKFKHIIGSVPESGLIIHLVKTSSPNIFHNMYLGFIVHPNGFLYAIKDGHIITNLTRNDSQGKNVTAMIKTGKYDYELRGDFTHHGVRFGSEKYGTESKLQFDEIEFEIDDCKGKGFLVSVEIADLPKTKIQRTPFLRPSIKPRSVYFTDEAAQLTDLTGGKGSSLGKLTKLSLEMKSKFIVPRGIVVTTAAYEEFLTNEIIDKINSLKNIVYGNVKGNIHEACKIVSCAIERASLPDKIAKEIEEKLNKLFDSKINNFKVAVRSSATGEDTDQMSAAGQMETFLGVQGLKEIFTAVKKCWASQFGFIAVEYKRQNGQILNSPMAVVIQEMVECEAAGVLFTCHPVTNNPSVIVITGNYGLGESVVSGSEEPDTVVLEKLPNDEVKMKNVIVGLKQHRIIMTAAKTSDEGGTVTEDVPEEEKNKCCISEEIALKLGKLSLEIENHFKSPRDIEWGIKNSMIYMLQSRPITTGAATSDYEIKHEFDSPLRSENEFNCKSNVGEVMPRATSPLGIDAVFKLLTMAGQNKIMRQKQRNLFLATTYYSTGLVCFYNHSMMSVADIATREGDVDDVAFQGIMVAIFGRILDDPELYTVIKRKTYDPVKKTIPFYLRFIKNLFFSGHGIEEIKEKVFNFQIPAEKGQTAKEIFELLTHTCSHAVKPALKHILCTEMSSLWNMLMLSILRKDKEGIDAEVYSDFSKLLASSSSEKSEVESADVPAAMQDLARSIVKDIGGEDFRTMSVEKALEWLETSTSLAGFKYRQFLKRHGHRCLKEFDMHSTTWYNDPKSLIKILQSMSNTCQDAKEKTEDNLSDILPKLSVSLNLMSRLWLKFVLANCRRGVREREACKSNYIKSLDNMRKGYQHLSKAMVAEGYLPDRDLLYFLTNDEILELLESRNPRIITRANHRRKLFPTLDALLFPEFSKGLPIPMNENQDDDEFEYVADLTMKGIPVSQGSVRAFARVALTLEEAANLKTGEILITNSTDIGWSPYFPILAGVVTELGGLISHGAVVSREYGLPCVVGLHGATRQFVTGDYVLLDGNKGILQRLSPPEK